MEKTILDGKEQAKVLTVVMPAYNAEKYIRTALDSLCVSAVLPLIEILVINDGSTDSTGQIAEEYCRRHPGSIRVISKENGGHGSGINTGIPHASGKYFKVVDADDWVDQEAFCRLVRTLERSDDDIVWSGFYWVYDKGEASTDKMKRRAEMTYPFRDVEYDRSYRFAETADEIYIKFHNLTIRTAILKDHHIRVDEKCFYEDMEYILYPIPYVRTIRFLEDFVYMYRIGSTGQSMSREKMRQNEKSMNTVLKSLFRFYRSLGKQIPCPEENRRYIESVIARTAAGKYRIMLCEDTDSGCEGRMRSFDRKLKERYPEIYKANRNKAVTLLRMTDFHLYTPASAMTRFVYR